jgi:triphosphoribosyl-dephospho-CoA synthase
MAESSDIERAFVAACEDELSAPKPGNVHLFAPGHGMEARDFVESAQAAAPPLCAPGARVGWRILDAIEATWARVGCNTNLGIVLLCAPLAHAAAQKGELRENLRRTLDGLDREDADLAFRAIMRASPAGLGAAPQHDVAEPATVTLREAMAAAADRDRIALQYATGFADVLGLGLEALAQARADGHDRPMTILKVFVAFASAFPDSHIRRKLGPEATDAVMARFRELASRLEAVETREEAFAAALELDRFLKENGQNPGTSADLTVATLFVDYLLAILPNVHKNG